MQHVDKLKGEEDKLREEVLSIEVQIVDLTDDEVQERNRLEGRLHDCEKEQQAFINLAVEQDAEVDRKARQIAELQRQIDDCRRLMAVYGEKAGEQEDVAALLRKDIEKVDALITEKARGLRKRQAFLAREVESLETRRGRIEARLVRDGSELRAANARP